ncbi:hypothetical protein RF11_12058 [Thelohanellus kitauei]|uniref:Uncharacterized protein n=1 Tax=Thelohanellus kitauei TaxID=669202 RepID=A0A0C2JHJ6_THEKT|nr:hypothetical protein RF11_12058 [Thelohanellus kitauei]
MVAERSYRCRTLHKNLSFMPESPTSGSRYTVVLLEYNRSALGTSTYRFYGAFRPKILGIFENIRPDLRRKMHIAQLTQKLYHDQPCREKSFERNNAVEIYDHKTKQYIPGTISNTTSPFSYIVVVESGYQRKHADHLRERIDVTPATQSKEFMKPVEEN